MASAVIEIHPKKPDYDPLAKQIRSELIEAGQPAKAAAVATRRLFRIEGNLTAADIEKAATTLLLDPVVEIAVIETATSKKSKGSGWMVDVWPKAGVTDPVGETVEKGLHDLGYKGKFHATFAQRYIFPKLKDEKAVRSFAEKFLANTLIHDIRLHKLN